MIVKKLGMVSGGGFPGAGYNERKVAEGVARLMAMENVDAAMRHKVELLHEAGFDCAGEIEKYLKGAVEDIRQHQDNALSVPHRRLCKGAGDVG